MSDSSNFDIYQYIPFRLVQVILKMNALLRPESTEQAVAIANLSQTEFRIMVLLASKGPKSPSAIADEYGFDRAVVTRALSSLNKQGLIAKEKVEGNQRSKIATLTPLGEEYAQVEFDVLHDYGAHLDHALEDGEKQQLFALLDKLLQANNNYQVKK